ncbi:hypothetical protein M1N11_04740 [Peptococcaceae bacterium]|nr:hypothetical protein [Peptococcaceae bacterium]
MMGIEEGIQKGMQKGELKKAREIAKEMLKQGSDIAFIKKVTKLSEEEILNLKSKV